MAPLQLRKFTLEDADRIALLVNDEAVSRWTAKIPFPYTPQHAIDWINAVANRTDRNPSAVLLANEIVACVSWWPTGENEIEVGYWVGRDYWGKGIASRGLGLMLAAPEFPRGQRVVGKVMEGNAASEKVLLANGFRFESTCPLERMGTPVPGKLFARSS